MNTQATSGMSLRKSLVGAWRLVSNIEIDVKSAEVYRPYGDKPEGVIQRQVGILALDDNELKGRFACREGERRVSVLERHARQRLFAPGVCMNHFERGWTCECFP
jgi:hypothetical protein